MITQANAQLRCGNAASLAAHRDVVQMAPREVTWLGGGQRYVVCAFYTPNYEACAMRLKTSLDELGINHHLAVCEGRGTWEATTRIKPGFVNACIIRFPDHDILYVDADAVLRKQPTFFDAVTTDVALLFAPVWFDGRRRLSLAAGTIYIRNTPGGRMFAQIWQEQEQHAGALTLDEDLLYTGFTRFEGLTFTALPRAYSKIFDADGSDPVIEHFQASRGRFKPGKLIRRVSRALRVVGIAATGALAAIGLISLLA